MVYDSTATHGRVSWYFVYNCISILTSINKKKWQINNLQRLSPSQIVFWIIINLIKNIIKLVSIHNDSIPQNNKFNNEYLLIQTFKHFCDIYLQFKNNLN